MEVNRESSSTINAKPSHRDNVINLDEDEETNYGNTGEKNCIDVHSNQGAQSLKLGMLVYSEDEAFNLYNHYALDTGFSVRKDQKRYRYIDGTKILRERAFVCWKEGFRDDPVDHDEITCERLETRTGCKASILFEVENGVWEIKRFNEEHNHELARPDQRHLLKSGRYIPDSTKGVIDSMVDAGIGPTKACTYIAKEVGGPSNMTFTTKDCHNYVQSRREKLFEPGDAQTVINHFKTKQAQDPMFFYSPYLDEEGRLTNFLWRDGRSKLDGECFRDVVIFDTTFRTNKYNMVCAPFVGVNHHWQNVLLGCAFLLDETTESFVWALQSFKEAMGGKAPQTIFTDQDQAMSNAIQIVFPGTCHRLCDWHISQNASKKIPHLYGKSEFKKKFNKCFHGCDTVEEFELTWKSMIEEFNASENKWLQNLYGLKEKWCPAFSNDVFSANIKSTQRSESMNNVFKQISCKTLTLTEFVKHYEESVEKHREAERIEDFRCTQGKPSVRVPVGILNHAADVYTCKIFKLFRKEFENSVAENIVDQVTEGNCDLYTLQKEGCKRKCVVQFMQSNSELTISCSCKKFEIMGLLCRHALRILNVKSNINKIPEKYILKRWTKFAKDGMTADMYFEPIEGTNKESRTDCLSKLMRKAFFAMNLATFDENTTRMVEEKMDQLVNDLMKYKGTLAAACANTHDSSFVSKEILTEKPSVLNPPNLRAKGETNARLKARIEKGKGKTKKTVTKMLQSDDLRDQDGEPKDQNEKGKRKTKRKVPEVVESGNLTGIQADSINIVPPELCLGCELIPKYILCKYASEWLWDTRSKLEEGHLVAEHQDQ